MSKRNVKLLLMNNNQIIIGTLDESVGEEGVVILKDTLHLQVDNNNDLGLAVHNLNGMIKDRVSILFQKTSITTVVDQSDINEGVLAQYLQWATGITQPVKPQILLQG